MAHEKAAQLPGYQIKAGNRSGQVGQFGRLQVRQDTDKGIAGKQPLLRLRLPDGSVMTATRSRQTDAKDFPAGRGGATGSAWPLRLQLAQQILQLRWINCRFGRSIFAHRLG
jgi:hypothetical protein